VLAKMEDLEAHRTLLYWGNWHGTERVIEYIEGVGSTR
jgi:hypothetical protein